MLTEEQIKNLKPGDIIYLNNYPLSFHDTCVNAENIAAYDNVSSCGEDDLCWFSREYLTLQPPPKHDPCRLFKEGDKVRVVEKDGRTVHDPLNGGLWKVGRNERSGGACETSVLVHLFYEDEKIAWQISVPFCFLELVHPVEELCPYHIEIGVTSKGEDYRVMKDEKIICAYSCAHPNAKAAAEAECKRLNEEWRKEHGNG